MKKKILYLECPQFASLPSQTQLLSISTEFDCTFLNSVPDSLNEIAKLKNIDIFVSNTASFDLFNSLRKNHPSCSNILVTELAMAEYSENLNDTEEDLIDHIISSRQIDNWTCNEIRVTIHKEIGDDIFGIEKYLAANTTIHEEIVSSNFDRERLNQKVFDYAKSCHLGQHLSRMAFGICEELLMNTVYDAPLAAGISRFKNIDQTQEVELLPEEQGLLRYGCDGRILAISTQDPFGALKKETLLKYLKKVLKRSSTEDLIDTKASGAGLGFFKILYSSHGIVCNVSPKKKTEIMALIHVNEHLRDFSVMPRSIHFFDC